MASLICIGPCPMLPVACLHHCRIQWTHPYALGPYRPLRRVAYLHMHWAIPQAQVASLPYALDMPPKLWWHRLHMHWTHAAHSFGGICVIIGASMPAIASGGIASIIGHPCRPAWGGTLPYALDYPQLGGIAPIISAVILPMASGGIPCIISAVISPISAGM